MTVDNFDKALAFFHDKRPFRPFTITLHNGTQYEVDHYRALAFSSGVAFYFASGNVPVLFDHESVSEITGDIKQPTP